MQAFLPLLGTDRARSGPPGRVVNIGSIYGSYGIPWQGAYCEHLPINPESFIRMQNNALAAS